MRGSSLAKAIDSEYRRKKFYENKRRQKCIIDEEKKCNICSYRQVCENNKEEDYEKMD